MLGILEKLNKEKQITVVIVLHEINNAFRFAHHIIGLKKGKVICEGKTEDVISNETLRMIDGIEAKFITDETDAYPICVEYELSRVQQ